MFVIELKVKAKLRQYSAIDDAIHASRFIRNKCVRYWMDNRGVGKYDLSAYCQVLAKEFKFADELNSQARQASAECAWSSIARFFDNFKKEDIKRVRLVKRADGYYCQFVLSTEVKEEVEPSGKAIGLDVGLSDFYTDNLGNKVENPRFLRQAERKLKRLQRQLSKKVKGSQNRNKARVKLSKAHLKVSRQRKDFAVKLARCVVRSNDAIVYEDLRVSNLVKNHCLAKSINNAAINILRKGLNTVGHTGIKAWGETPSTLAEAILLGQVVSVNQESSYL